MAAGNYCSALRRGLQDDKGDSRHHGKRVEQHATTSSQDARTSRFYSTSPNTSRFLIPPRETITVRDPSHSPEVRQRRESLVVPASALDMENLRKEITYLQQHAVIVSFVTPLAEDVRHEQWVRELGAKIRSRVDLIRITGAGFYFIRLDSPERVQSVLHLTPCRLSVGLALFQKWVPAFNPSKPSGQFATVWISLIDLPEEYVCMAQRIAGSVGKVLEVDSSSGRVLAPRFQVILTPGQPRVPKLDIASTDGSYVEVTILYDEPNPDRVPGKYHNPRHRTPQHSSPGPSGNWQASPHSGPGPTRATPSRARQDQPPEDRRGQPDDDGFTTVVRKQRTSPTHRPRQRRSHRGGRSVRERQSVSLEGPTAMDVEPAMDPSPTLRQAEVNSSSPDSKLPETARPSSTGGPSRNMEVEEQPPLSAQPPPLQPWHNPVHLSDLDPPLVDDSLEASEMEVELILDSLPLSASTTPARPRSATMERSSESLQVGSGSALDPCVIPCSPKASVEPEPRPPVQLEPASITLELLGITPQARNCIFFHTGSDGEEDEGDYIPNPHEEEAFEDAQNGLLSPVTSDRGDGHVQLGSFPADTEPLPSLAVGSLLPRTGHRGLNCGPSHSLQLQGQATQVAMPPRFHLNHGPGSPSFRTPQPSRRTMEELDNERVVRHLQMLTAERVRPCVTQAESSPASTSTEQNPSPVDGCFSSVRSAKAAARARSSPQHQNSSPGLSAPSASNSSGLDCWGHSSITHKTHSGGDAGHKSPNTIHAL